MRGGVRIDHGRTHSGGKPLFGPLPPLFGPPPLVINEKHGRGDEKALEPSDIKAIVIRGLHLCEV